jgi:hypothetical protein
MKIRRKRTAALLPVLLVPFGLLVGQGLGCDDGGPGDVLVPATLDGYDCPICKDVSADADFDGDEAFPEAEVEDAPDETDAQDAGADASKKKKDADTAD